MGAPTGWDPHGGPEGEPLCYRDPWKVGTCWVGDDLPAISGIGSNHDAMLDGVRIFDVEDRRGIISFAGPRGWFFGDCRRLCSASPHGLEIWDPTTGERTGSAPGFTPTRQGNGQLAALENGELITWRK